MPPAPELVRLISLIDVIDTFGPRPRLLLRSLVHMLGSSLRGWVAALKQIVSSSPQRAAQSVVGECDSV